MDGFDKEFKGFFGLFTKSFGVILGMVVLSSLVSLAFVGTIIYLLLKNFG